MFQKTKFLKNYIIAVGMSLVMLMASAFGLLIETKVGQITPPLATDTWEDYAVKPSGSATEADPWKINTASELAYLINNIGDGTYYIELNSNIDLAGHEWTPIKSIKKNAKINFDGKDHTISNLTIDTVEENKKASFFEEISYNYDASLHFSNTIFNNVNINGPASVGTIVGYAINTTIINVIIQSGSIKGNSYVGGIGGMLWGSCNDCVNNARIYSKEGSAGGIVGHGNTQHRCINTGTVIGGNAVGGIVGYGEAEDCFSSGTVRTSYNNCVIGGVVGYGTAINSGFDGTIECNYLPDYLGSIAGNGGETDEIKNSFGVAEIHLDYENADTAIVNKFGAIVSNNLNNSYSYSKVFALGKSSEEYRKYKGTDFSAFAYHKNINGGFPFHKTLFAVGQFLSGDVLAYLQQFGFSSN